MKSVVAVCKAVEHTFSKICVDAINLIAGEGVEGDAHRGRTVQHLSRIRRDPSRPNLRQIHLIHFELIEMLQAQGFAVYPGAMGENITTRGVDLLDLPTGTQLAIGPVAVVEITGLRNPCAQLDRFQDGLMQAVLDRDSQGNLIRKAGVMGIVLNGGSIRSGDTIKIIRPPEPHRTLQPV